ncbi:hypothetical protein FB451DRAFT_1191062 [Mycena latifolia]|nr:hypothetical protein FB451DRAFT_1191062 [Mycena latifolia]
MSGWLWRISSLKYDILSDFCMPAPIMRDPVVSQLQSSILLGALSLIPNDTLRYTLLAIAACLGLLYAIPPRGHHSGNGSNYTRCKIALREGPRNPLGGGSAIVEVNQPFRSMLTAYLGHRVKRSASNIRSRMLETNTLTWKTYRLLSRDISDCVKKLIVEAERQRKYTNNIKETESILTSIRSPGVLVYQHNMSNDEQSHMSIIGIPVARLLTRDLSV